MKLAIGNDHVAVEMKKEIKKYLEDKGIEVIDVGTNSTESFNYPISGYKVGKMVASGEVDGGVPVSYTHLTGHKGLAGGLAEGLVEDVHLRQESDAHHQDVYKRQAPTCPATRPGWWS